MACSSSCLVEPGLFCLFHLDHGISSILGFALFDHALGNPMVEAGSSEVTSVRVEGSVNVVSEVFSAAATFRGSMCWKCTIVTYNFSCYWFGTCPGSNEAWWGIP